MSHRQQLRVATQDSHQRVDQLLSANKMFSSRVAYQSYLRIMQSLHRHCRDSIARVEAKVGLPGSEASLDSALRSDLASTGFDDAESLEESPCDFPPDDEDWGRAYVVEGSALGGRYLAKLAAKGLPPGCTHQYLDRLAENAVRRWPAFVAALDQQADLDIGRAITAGRDVFRYVETAAVRHLHSPPS